jgi:hypothetical protein
MSNILLLPIARSPACAGDDSRKWITPCGHDTAEYGYRLRASRNASARKPYA